MTRADGSADGAVSPGHAAAWTRLYATVVLEKIVRRACPGDVAR